MQRVSFESSVISYGSKTKAALLQAFPQFESSVISYGSKTQTMKLSHYHLFESSVISYGSKTSLTPNWCSLRV